MSPADGSDSQLYTRYQVDYDDALAGTTVEDFWRMFCAIRVYRQLGTAQAETVLSTLFSGHSIGMSWADALDSALADVLADQLQVLVRDEQAVLVAYLAHAADTPAFTARVRSILADTSDTRQSGHLGVLRLGGATWSGESVAERRASLDPAGAFELGTATRLARHGGLA